MDKINSRIKDTPNMLNIIDDINNNNMITDSSILVSFDIVNMFPSIDNISGLDAVSEILSKRESYFPPAGCILEALSVCNVITQCLIMYFIYREWYSHGPPHVTFLQ